MRTNYKMAKQTRRMSKKHHLPMHAMTFCGVSEWHKAMFEKYGWMILSKEKGYDFKIVAYKKSIDHLIMSIKHLMMEYEENDRKHDLAVLLMNAECLKMWAAKL